MPRPVTRSMPTCPASDRRTRAPNSIPMSETIGIDEEHDPEHLAASLVELIRFSAGQEVASHTFSHYYCLEPGQNETMFRADLAAAQTMALRRGIELTSLVLPRNQWNPAYAAAVLDQGFHCIRGPQRSWGHRSRQDTQQNILHRGARMADSYIGVSPPPTTAWEQRPASVRTLQCAGKCIPATVRSRPQAT